jgi:predicted permease
MSYDLTFAWRSLWKSPGFAATAILTLALAIGANTAVFSLVDAVLMRPLPYAEPDGLGTLTRSVTLDGVTRVEPLSAHTGAVWEAVRDHATTVRAAVFSTANARVNLVAGDQALAVRQQRVGAGYFGVLGVSPSLGREFAADEDVPGGPAVTILSEQLWRALFDGDRAVVGRTILLRGEPHAVVGIMPDTFRSMTEADLWTPLRPDRTGEGSGTNYMVIARLRPGVDWPQARAEMAAVADPELAVRETRQGGVIAHDLVPMQAAFTASARGSLVTLWVAAGLVLLVAAVNLAGLLLARAGQRTREIATRMAIGGGRAAIVRQLLTESVLLAAIGGALGLAVGALGLRTLNALAGSLYYAPWAKAAALDARAVAMTVALTALTAVVFGLVPALQASRLDVNAALSEGGTRGVAGGARGWPRCVLVAGQVALGVVLLVGAGLLVRTYLHLDGAPAGFEPARLVTTSASLEDARYTDADAVVRLFDDSVARLEALPGVEAAAVSLGLPYQRILNMGFRTIAGGEPSPDARFTNTTYVTPHYFETLRQPILQGRAIEPTDTAGSQPVVVVNEAFVRLYLQGRDPLGVEIHLSDAARRIVGVAADVRQTAGFMGYGPVDALPQTYLPVTQVDSGFFRLVHVWFAPTWIIRASVPGTVTDPLLRDVMRAVDAHLPISALQGIDDVRAVALARERLRMLLLGVLGVVALLLSAIGLHGLIASTVTERMREFGIRLALGATVGDAIRSAALPGLRLTLAGLAIGSLAALGATRFIRSLLWGVSETDVVTYLAVAGLLLAVAVVASVGPALRLRRLDPLVLLRD